MTSETHEPRVADVCAKFFLFLTTFRRNAGRIETDATWLRRNLVQLVEEQEAELRAYPDLKTIYQKARYPIVALADEVALNTSWRGQQEWEDELLEQHFFGTSIAGEDFFERLKEVRPDEDQLAEIYFICLSLGFRGRYRSRPEERQELQQRLYSQIPNRITKKSDLLSPGVYEQNVERDMTKLPVVSAARYAVILAGAILLAMGSAHFVTQSNFEMLHQALDRILGVASR
ncbi:MAG: DotU family type IV/VI secretion system protein [Planctomycetota bacterium]